MLMFMSLGASLGDGKVHATAWISLLGSAVLILTAIAALFRLRAIGYVATGAVLCIWLPYLQMTIASVFATPPPSAHGTSHASVSLMPLLLWSAVFAVSIIYPVASIFGLRKVEA